MGESKIVRGKSNISKVRGTGKRYKEDNQRKLDLGGRNNNNIKKETKRVTFEESVKGEAIRKEIEVKGDVDSRRVNKLRKKLKDS